MKLFEFEERKAFKHPAQYTNVILPRIASMLRESHVQFALDPFAGTGRCFLIKHWLPNCHIEGVEIEPEWAAMHPQTTLGNALKLPYLARSFDAIFTSPTYGNRIADQLVGGERHTYANYLGRKVSKGSSASLQWGPKYRDFHVQAWNEANRVLVSDGIFVLNIKDHIRNGERQHVTEWHIQAICDMGFTVDKHVKIDCPGQRHGQNGDARVPYESVIKFIRSQNHESESKKVHAGGMGGSLPGE